MYVRTILLAFLLIGLVRQNLSALTDDTLTTLIGIVYDDTYVPVPATHVINLNTYQGSVTDSLGIFRIPVHRMDTLLIRNIAFQDTLVTVALIASQRYVVMKRKIYPLLEARIFEWGSTYGDFREAIVEMPNVQTFGESMGLPKQDPDYIPFDMNEAVLKNPLFLVSSPVSYFYYNFSRQARSARKVYWLKKNREKYEIFDEIMGGENISSITGLRDAELQQFMAFLFERLVCDFKCTELQLYTEIYTIWELYCELQERRMIQQE